MCDAVGLIAPILLAAIRNIHRNIHRNVKNNKNKGERKNTDACGTADCCPFLSIVDNQYAPDVVPDMPQTFLR